ncbi:MAG: signal peptidase I [Pseudomonadota bacterium]
MAHLALLQVDHLTVKTLLRLPFWILGTVLLFFWVPVVLPVAVVKAFGGGYYSIPSGSMRPTLEPGDAILALKHDPFETLRRGSIYVFKHPRQEFEYIARAMALPGDSVQMINGVLQINGTDVQRDRIQDYHLISNRPIRQRSTPCDQTDSGEYHCIVAQFEETLGNEQSYLTLDFGQTPVDNTPPVSVPDGRVFMIGDNRDNSVDSRFQSVGLVPIENIRHVPWVFYLSWDDPIRSFSKLFRPI